MAVIGKSRKSMPVLPPRNASDPGEPMNLLRVLRHFWTTPLTSRRAFPKASMQRIAHAVAAAEATHSGEIRVAIEGALPWSYLRRRLPSRARAVMLFSKLRVWDTEHNNGVLLYVQLADRAIEIVADRGIAHRVARTEWDAVALHIREHFRRRDLEAGVIAGVQAIGAKLAQYFPLAAGATHANELSNRPTLL